MSLSSSQTSLLKLIKQKIKELKNLVFGFGLNEDQFAILLKNIMRRSCPRNYLQSCVKDKSFLAIVQKLAEKNKESETLLISILTEIDHERACFEQEKESSSEVVEVKRAKSGKRSKECVVKVEEGSEKDRGKIKKEQVMMKKKIIERMKKRKREGGLLNISL